MVVTCKQCYGLVAGASRHAGSDVSREYSEIHLQIESVFHIMSLCLLILPAFSKASYLSMNKLRQGMQAESDVGLG